MNDLIKIKGGNGTVPALQDKELAYSRDEKALLIGTPNGNVTLCRADDIENIEKNKTNIAAVNQKMAEYEAQNFATTEYVDKLIEQINARLDALTPNE